MYVNVYVNFMNCVPFKSTSQSISKNLSSHVGLNIEGYYFSYQTFYQTLVDLKRWNIKAGVISMTLANDFQSLFIITKSSKLDVAEFLYSPLEIYIS